VATSFVERLRLERLSDFCVDPDSADEKLVFNCTVTLRNSRTKIEQKQKS
jgi:hypothetical protein